jgi:hypothetical protein
VLLAGKGEWHWLRGAANQLLSSGPKSQRHAAAIPIAKPSIHPPRMTLIIQKEIFVWKSSLPTSGGYDMASLAIFLAVTILPLVIWFVHLAATGTVHIPIIT